jgi:predicted tellurium resistance membrane protein TerC
MELLSNPDAWIAFLTLCALEIVLGIDNIIFISILASRLPAEQQVRARQTGIALALILRLLLLFSISWMMGLTAPLFFIGEADFTGRDLILLFGGLFLIYKSVKEIHHKMEEAGKDASKQAGAITFQAVVAQILLVDLVFSLDSVITAVGMVKYIEVMIAAVIVSVLVMLAAAAPVSNFVNRHPAVKVLALAFLLMIGTALVAQGLGFYIPKGYIYFAMAFSTAVEFLNIRISSRSKSAA